MVPLNLLFSAISPIAVSISAMAASGIFLGAIEQAASV
jgi:hypothetical protein